MNEKRSRRGDGGEDGAPLIIHLVYRLTEGGLENGLINIVSRTPSWRFRHLIVALDRVGDFAERLPDRERQTVALHSLESGHLSRHLAVFRLLRQYRPAILHTRNLPALEFQLTGLLAGVRVRIHSEHGRDVADKYGKSRKYKILRRAVDPVVTGYVTVNEELAAWLRREVGVAPGRIRVIRNGVDCARFRPEDAEGDGKAILPPALLDRTIVGCVGRMEEVKGHLNLVRAFLRLRAQSPTIERKVGLVIVGDGPERSPCLSLLEAGAAADAAWLPGTRFDVERIYRAFDVFALPSRAEGMSNTILEAMATAIPVVSTDVGAARELVVHGISGLLVPAADTGSLAASLSDLLTNEVRRRRMGEAGRCRALEHFSLDSMVDSYLGLYARALAPKGS